MKELPKGHKKFKIKVGWCGDDACNCHYVHLYSVVSDDKLVRLWESDYIGMYFDEYQSGLLDLKEEVEKAAKHYGVTFKLTDEIWDWEEDND